MPMTRAGQHRMRGRSPELLLAALALAVAAMACGFGLLVGWSALPVFGLAALAVARRLDPKPPRNAPDRPGVVAVIETYANQLANKRKADAPLNFIRLAHIARTTGFALLATGIYILIRQQL
jgi:hypothetical protein